MVELADATSISPLQKLAEVEIETLGLREAHKRYWERVRGQRMGRKIGKIVPLSKTFDPYGAAESPQ